MNQKEILVGRLTMNDSIKKIILDNLHVELNYFPGLDEIAMLIANIILRELMTKIEDSLQ